MIMTVSWLSAFRKKSRTNMYLCGCVGFRVSNPVTCNRPDETKCYFVLHC